MSFFHNGNCLSLTRPVWLFRLINTFNRDPHDVFQGDTSKAGKKRGSLGSKANSALTNGLLILPIHRYMIKEKVYAPAKGSKLHRCPSSDWINTYSRFRVDNTASIGSGHAAQVAGSMWLQQAKTEQPTTDQHKSLLAASAAQTSAVDDIVFGEEGAAAHAVYDNLRTTLPTALASTADSLVCHLFPNACHASPHHHCILHGFLQNLFAHRLYLRQQCCTNMQHLAINTSNHAVVP